MSDAIALALLLGGGIIVIGFLSNLLFERTGFPDMLLLIILGAILGPILGLFEPSSIMSLAPYLAALALVFIDRSIEQKQSPILSLKAQRMALLKCVNKKQILFLIMQRAQD